MKSIGMLLFACVIIGISLLWQSYKWGECRKVGHSKFYCVMTAGR